MINNILIDTLINGTVEINVSTDSINPFKIDTTTQTTGSVLHAYNNIGTNLKVDNDGKVSFRNYYFPILDGTSSQYMVTGGNGVLSWISLPSSLENPTIRSVSTNTTLLNTDKTVLVDRSTSQVIITVPTNGNYIFNIKKIDSSINTLKIIPSSGTIDGASEKIIEYQYSSLTVHTNGTNAYII